MYWKWRFYGSNFLLLGGLLNHCIVAGENLLLWQEITDKIMSLNRDYISIPFRKREEGVYDYLAYYFKRFWQGDWAHLRLQQFLCYLVTWCSQNGRRSYCWRAVIHQVHSWIGIKMHKNDIFIWKKSDTGELEQQKFSTLKNIKNEWNGLRE